MNFTHEHEEIRRPTGRYVEEQVNPHILEWEAAGLFPADEVFKGMGDLGLFGITKPEEYGGLGLDYQYVQFSLAERKTELGAARALAYQATADLVAGRDVTLNASVARRLGLTSKPAVG